MRWAAELRDIDLEVKGLWLVDFDNGEGYYCWRYPEETVGHYHTYEKASPDESRSRDRAWAAPPGTSHLRSCAASIQNTITRVLA